jgi:phytoene desaturase
MMHIAALLSPIQILSLSKIMSGKKDNAKSAVVIGSGVAGLAIAARLAARGLSVKVFEKNGFPGGKLSDLKIGEYRFDAGPSLFTVPHWVDEIFEQAGKDPEKYFRYRRLPVVCKYFWQNGKSLEVNSEPSETAANMAREFGEDPEALGQYLRKSRKKYELAGEIFLQQPLNRLRTWTDKRVLKALGFLSQYDLFKSLHKTNRRHFKSTEIIQLFDRYATYNGSDPYKTSGMFSMIPHIEMNGGAYAPEGGMYSIALSLFELGKDLGVDYVFNSEVVEIIIENKRARGVQLSDGTVENANVVVTNMDVQLTYENLLPDVKMPAFRKLEERSSSGFIFYWGINRTFPELDVHNIFFGRDYKSEFDAIARGTFSEDPTIYVNITSKYAPRDAPAGCENWFVMINGPNDRGQDWEKWRGILREKVIQRIKDRLNVDLSNHIEVEDVLDPVRLSVRTLSADGALYGSSSNTMWAAFLRQSNRHSRIKNLYFCGGTVHPGGGIPLCISSAKIVDCMVAGDLKL